MNFYYYFNLLIPNFNTLFLLFLFCLEFCSYDIKIKLEVIVRRNDERSAFPMSLSVRSSLHEFVRFYIKYFFQTNIVSLMTQRLLLAQ